MMAGEFVLALGGGGGRGLAHLGVLEALEEHELRPAAIIGTSIGALFGTLYALTPDIEHVRNRVKDFLQSESFSHMGLPYKAEADTSDHTWLGRLTAAARESVLYTRAATHTAIADKDALQENVAILCEHKSFEDVEIPVFITTVHFPTGEIEIFSKGDLIRAVSASMAIPGVFEPVEIDSELFVDGGLACDLPAKEAKMIAKAGQIVVAIDVGARPRPDYHPESVIAMLDWTNQIKSLYLRQFMGKFADVLIQAVPGFRQWSDFSHPDKEIERGHQATLEHIPTIMKLIGI
jgi:NTE family protein